MWDAEDRKLLDSVTKLLSTEEKTGKGEPMIGEKPKDECSSTNNRLLGDLGRFMNKSRVRMRSSPPGRDLRACRWMLRVRVDHAVADPRNRKTGIKLVFKNISRNPTMTAKCCTSKKLFFKSPDDNAKLSAGNFQERDNSVTRSSSSSN